MSKYSEHRAMIQTGDIILCHGNSFTAKGIQWADNAYYNHSLVAWNVGARKFAIDAWNNGVEVVPLSRRMDTYLDFCIVRKKNPNQSLIEFGINQLISQVETNAKYDYAFLLRKLLILKLGVSMKRLGRIDKFVCSELTQFFTNTIDIQCYSDLELITPQDFIRKADKQEVDIMLNDSLK